MFKKSILLSLFVSAPGFAQKAPSPDAAADSEAGAVIVTATRIPLDADRVASSVTVLDKAAIDRAGDLGVSDLLLRTPGVSISRNGGYGTTTSLRIRGAETDQTVVVIDGVKLNDPSSPGGGYNFGNMLVGDASRIEVLRGPQSILWGSQAIGGVVNIVTPLPTGALQGNFDVEGGSRDTISARAAVGAKTGPLAWRIGGQTFTTQGVSAYAPGTETDGYTNRSVTGRGVLDLTSNVSVDVRGYYSRGRNGFDGFNVDDPEYALTREFVGYAGLNVALLDGRLRNRIAYGYTNTDRDNYNPTHARTLTFDSLGRNERIEYQGSFAIATGWDAVFGVENEKSRFATVSPSASLAVAIPAPVRGNAELTSVYGQLNAEVIKGLTLTAGVREDDHSRYGSKTLFAGGAAWALPSGTVLRASYAEGFKAPTLYQLFSDYGNAALNPEEAKGWEAGAEQHLLDGAITIGGTYFQRRTTNQIVFTGCVSVATNPLCVTPGTTNFRFGYYQNSARAYAQGIEAIAAAKIGGRVRIDGNYTWTQSVDRSAGSTYGNWLPRRPQHMANASVTYSFPSGLSAGVAVRYAGMSFDDAANQTRLAPYTLVDLRGELPISRQIAVFARAENVLDEKYQTAFNYGTLGRSVYAGFRGRF